MVMVVVVCPGLDVVVGSGKGGEGVASGSKYMHTFRKVYGHFFKKKKKRKPKVCSSFCLVCALHMFVH